MTGMAEAADTIDLVDIGRAIGRGWRALATCIVLGGLAGFAILELASPKFGGSASVVVRASQNGGASLLSKLGLGDATPALSGAASSPIETEVAILSSRALMAKVVDSLDLDIDVRSPRGVAARDVIGAKKLAPAFLTAKYDVDRVSDKHYRITDANGKQIEASAGAPIVLPQGTIVLRADTTLPSHLSLRLMDGEDALINAGKRLNVAKTGGEVVTISFQARDSMTAAAVPNALVAEYLHQRKTVDRGTNAYRVAFLGAQIDSVSRDLTKAEDSLRRFQEATGVLQPDVQGKLQLDRAADIRKDIGALDVERGALTQLSSQVATGKMTPAQLAAYPTFLKSPGINELLGQLVKVQTDRTQLLERRLETDPEAVAMAQSAKNIENQISALTLSYKASLDHQRADLNSQLDSIRVALGTFPGAVESSGRLQRRAKELAQTYTALQAQLVDARLAAIGEGGDVRLLDVATPPKKVAFPRPLTTVGIGVGAGLFVGLVLALLTGFLGRYVEDPHAIERTTGVPALKLDGGVPLLVAGGPLSNTLLLVPIDARANTAGVAERLARTALARSAQPTVLDLSRSNGNGSSSTALTMDVNATIHRLEQEHGMVIVRLPALAADETAAALTPERAVLLVAPPGRVERRLLLGAVQTLRRLDVHCAGVVVSRSTDAVVA